MQCNQIPFTSVQWAIWADQQFLSSEHPAYVVGGGVEIYGHIDVACLQRAVQYVIDRHETLRSVIVGHGGDFCLEVRDDCRPPFTVHDFTGAADPRAAAMAWTQERMRTPFAVLTDTPLCEFAYLTIADTQGFFIFRYYHQISDGWGGLIVLREVGIAYNAFCAGRVPELPPAPSYREFVAAETAYLTSASMEKDRQYFRQVLGELPPPLFVQATDLSSGFGESRRISVPIRREIFQRFCRVLSEAGVSTTVGMMAVIFLYLSRHTGRADVVMGMPVLNRKSMRLREVIGYFTHLLPISTSIDPAAPLATLLQTVNRLQRAHQRHASFPVHLIQQEFRAQSPVLYDVTFNHLTNRLGVSYGDQRSVVRYFTNQHEPRNLGFSLCEFDETNDVDLFLDYSLNYFSEAEAQTIAQRVIRLLTAIADDGTRNCGDYDILSEAETEELLALGAGPTVTWPDTLTTLPALIAAQVAATPDRPAVVFDGATVTYATLARRAYALAHTLQAHGVTPGDRVAVVGERSTDLLVALLGVLHAGGVYVPLDPGAPPARLTGLLEDCASTVVLDLRATEAPVLTSGPVWLQPEALTVEADTPPAITLDAHAPAYLIYTSGSTGAPKGVLVEHGSFLNMIQAQIAGFGLTAVDRVVQFASPAFDASLAEIFMALGAGACLYPVTRAQVDAPEDLRAFFTTQGISVATLPPAYLRLFAQAAFPTLRVLITAGEAAHPGDARHYAGQLAYFNAYGPTECAVCATFGRVDPTETGPVSLGRPLPNTRLYVLDAAGRLLPRGVPGELVIAGAGVAREYWQRPALTAEKFPNDPFVPGACCYRTGDRVRWRPDGALEFLGRVDQQVKLRGYRVEPGEVAACAETVPGVRQAVALVAPGPDGNGQLRLFVAGEAELETVRQHLQANLPSYMIPSQILTIPAIPQTLNGKVDQRALLALETHPTSEAALDAPPATALERRIAAVWEAVLGHAPIGRHDAFFELGGNSLLAMKIIGRLERELGKTLSLREFITAETIAEFAKRLEANTSVVTTTEPVVTVVAGNPQPASIFPLTHAQRHLWGAQSIDKDAIAYNMPIALELTGKELHADAIEQVWRSLINRHEALRTSFTEVEGEPQQVIHAEVPFDLARYDVSSATQPIEQARAIVNELCATPFDLELPPLVRVGFIRLASCHHVLVICLHHIVGDGDSLTHLLQDFCVLMNGVTTLPPATASIRDILRVETDYLVSPKAANAREYWSTTLHEAEPLTDLPMDFPRPDVQSYQGDRATVLLPAEISTRIVQLAQETHTSLFAVYLSLVQALLHRYSGQEDLVVGIPSSLRAHYDAPEWVGYLVNPLAVRINTDGTEAFTQLIRRVYDALLAGLDHAAYPFDMVVSALGKPRDPSRSPVFDVMVVPDALDAVQWNIHGYQIRRFMFDFPVAKFDLTFSYSIQHDGAVQLMAEYNTSLFAQSSVVQMLDHLAALAASVARDAELPVNQQQVLTEAETEELLALGTGPTVTWPDALTTLPALIAAQVAAAPDHPAVVFDGATVTYATLARRAYALAQMLQAHGVTPGDRVAVLGERSTDLLVALLGVLHAGGVYVPLDPGAPPARLTGLLEDCAPTVVLDLRADAEASVLMPGVAWLQPETLTAEADTPPAITLDDHAPAYLIYTSGSTGTPKGVLVEHGSFLNMIQAQIAGFGLTAADRVLQFASPAFDASLSEIFMALGAGACLYPVTRAQVDAPEELRALLTTQQISVATLPPAYLRLFAQAAFPTLRVLITAGEAAHPGDARHYAGQLAYFNAYGPTECAVCATFGRVDPTETGPVSLGRPLPNTRLYVLDAAGRLLPRGVPGELVIAGAGVAREYWQRPALTAEKFPNDPFVPGARCYRTGDRVRWRPDGTLEFLGRVDQQVKLRGYRVEPGEVAACAETVPGVRQAVALVAPGPDGNGQLRLFVVGEAEVAAVRQQLQAQLPSYLLPSQILTIPAIPQTLNGKVDQRALLALETHPTSEATLDAPPATALERQLAAVWEAVLDHAPIGRYDAFFELGGDSIQAMRVCSRLRAEGITVTPKQIFTFPTIEKLAGAIAQQQPTTQDSAYKTEETLVPFPLTPIQQWFFSRPDTAREPFTQTVLLASHERLDVDAMHAAVTAVMEYHDALRLRFPNGTTQEYAENTALTWAMCDLREMPHYQHTLEELAADVIRSMDPTQGTVFGAVLLRLPGADHLYLVAHHLVIDAYSWQIVIDDIATAYRQRLTGTPICLPVKTASYRSWAEALVASSESVATEEPYWQAVCAAEDQRLLGNDGDGPLRHGAYQQVVTELDVETTQALLTASNQAYHTTTVELLLTALAEALGRCHQGKKTRILFEAHGRDSGTTEVDVARTVGWFTALFPLLLDTDPRHSLRNRIRMVKECFRAVPNRGNNYNVLRYLHGTPALDANAQLVFNYFGQLQQSDNALLSLRKDTLADSISADFTHDAALLMTAMVVDDRLQIIADYHATVFAATTVQQLLHELNTALSQVVDHCRCQSTWELTPAECMMGGENSLEDFDRLLVKTHLTPTEVDDILPITPSQAAMLYQSLAEPDGLAYFQQFRLDLQGALCPDVMACAWEDVAKRHPALRSVFHTNDLGVPLQLILRAPRLVFAYEDIQSLGEQAAASVEAAAKDDLTHPFDLGQGPLMRVRLWQVAPQQWSLLWSFHHILMDGWCLGLVLGDLFRTYEALCSETAPAPPNVPSPRGYLEWLREQKTGESAAFWQEYLAGYETTASIPRTSKPQPNTAYRNQTHTRLVSHEHSERLVRAGAHAGVTLSTIFQVAWGVLLARYANSRDVAFGVVVAGRPAEVKDIEQTVGTFLQTIPCRITLPAGESFTQVAATVQAQYLSAEAHCWYPLADIQAGSPLHAHLLDHILIFENYPLDRTLVERPAEGIKVCGVAGVEQIPYDLGITVVPGDEIGIRFSYNGEAYTTSFIENLGEQFVRLLMAITADPHCAWDTLPYLTPEDERRLHAGNATTAVYPSETTVPHLFFEQAARTPDRIALIEPGIHTDCALTYADLAQQVCTIAGALRHAGVMPGQSVAVLLERNAQLVAGLLAVQAVGCAYVPLDPVYPAERLRYILTDSGATLLLTQRDLLGAFGDESALPEQMVFVDELTETVDEAPDVMASGDALAYVIYTSGSTGRPKGVEITQHNLVNFLWAIQREPGLSAADRLLAVTTVSFDIAGLELYLPLLTGASLVLAGRHDVVDPARLATLIRQYDITLLQATPVTWRMLLDDGWTGHPGLRMLVGGEALPGALAQRMLVVGSELWNMYGPTETTIWSTLHRVTPADLTDAEAVVAIGTPIANTTVYVVGTQGELLPRGAVGELLIGGAGVARGYRQQPALTAERFVHWPQLSDGVLYRTGDLVAWNADGTLAYHGRVDSQVKVRGFRIELGEIEAALATHPAVRAAAVVVRPDAQQQPHLVAYLEGDPITADALRAHVQRVLPEYMVPSIYVPLAALPVTSNGKVDRRALPAPDAASLECTGPYVAPRTPEEVTLADIWAQVLGVERVGIHDNFFEIGGHSLRATQVISRLRAIYHQEIPLRLLFEQPTVASLATALQQEVSTDSPTTLTPILPAPRTGMLPLSFAQERLWFLDQLLSDSSMYNMPGALRLHGVLDIDALTQSVNLLIARHETLRTTFAVVDGVPRQLIADTLTLPIPLHDLRALTDATREAEAARLQREHAQRPFDLTTGPLLRVALVQMADEEYLLLLNMHHIISDGWSIEVILRELSVCYRAVHAGTTPILPTLPVQYADFALWQRQYLSGETLARQLAYWRDNLAELPTLNLPTDRPRPAVQTHTGATFTFRLPQDKCTELAAVCRTEGATLFMGLLAAFTALLSRYSGQTDIAVGTPIANRAMSETEGLIGFFANTLVLRNDLFGMPSWRELLRRVRESALGAYAHQDVPFEQLVAELQPVRDMSRNPLFQVLFALQEGTAHGLYLPALTTTPLEDEHQVAKFDQSWSFTEDAEGVVGIIEYNTDLFDRTTIATMAQHYQQLLTALVDAPEEHVAMAGMLLPEEKTQLLDTWQGTTAAIPECGVHELFARQAARTPDAIAVTYGDAHLTYAELNRRANQLAHYLRAQGVGPDTLVGISLHRSLEMVVGLYGILKAGGAYVPLDPTYPQDRIAYVLADSGAHLVLTERAVVDTLPTGNYDFLLLDACDAQLSDYPVDDPEPLAPFDALAYVIYTSGSTGRPKGVEITQRNLVNFLWAMQREPGLSAADRLLAVTTVSFDIAGLELYLPLLTGASLVLAGRHDVVDPARLATLIRQYDITLLQATPVTWRMLLDDGWTGHPGLRMLVGGEAVPVSLARRLLAVGSELWNMYGPTETTIWSTVHRVTPTDLTDAEAVVAIGTPIANTTVYVVGTQGELLPRGAVGELLIGGAGVACGYRQQPTLTAERFVHWPQLCDGVLYRTGDLVAWNADGTLAYHGRVDSQVKVRGFRIELGEIEAALATHPAVRAAAVVVRPDAQQQPQLVAYFEGDPITADTLRAHVQCVLPEYMVPSIYVPLAALPVTSNGKVDRRALPAPDATSLGCTGPYVAPRTPEEVTLADIWAQVLGVERVGINDNFFALGGDSIRSIQVIARAKQANLLLTPMLLFQHQTIEELAAVAQSETMASVVQEFMDDVSCVDRDPSETDDFTLADFPLASVSQDDLEGILEELL